MGGRPKQARTQAREGRGMEEEEEPKARSWEVSRKKLEPECRSLRQPDTGVSAPHRSLRPQDRSLRPPTPGVFAQDSGLPQDLLWNLARSLDRSPTRSLRPPTGVSGLHTGVSGPSELLRLKSCWAWPM